MSAVILDEHFDTVSSALESNKRAALYALGVKGVELALDKMDHGYGKRIFKTGKLYTHIEYDVERSGEDTVDIGTNVEYAQYVHDGTRKMAGRPFIRDGIMDNKEELQTLITSYLKRGMD